MRSAEVEVPQVKLSWWTGQGGDGPRGSCFGSAPAKGRGPQTASLPLPSSELLKIVSCVPLTNSSYGPWMEGM